MAIVLDRSEQVSGGEIVDSNSFVMYVAQTFVAEGKALEDVAYFLEDTGANPHAYRFW